MFKKSLSAGLAGLMILLSASGAFGASYEQTYGEDACVIVTGETDADTLVGIQVLKPGKTIGDLLADLRAAQEYVVYNNQTVSDENGKYTFEFKVDGENGVYPAYLIDANGVAETLEISFINNSEYEAFLLELNRLAAGNDYAGFYEVLSAHLAYFGTDVDQIRESISLRKASDRICDYAKAHPLSMNSAVSPSVVYNTYVVIQAVQEGKLSGMIHLTDKVYSNADIGKWQAFVEQKTTASAHMDSVMAGLKPETLEQFGDALLEATILSVIRDSGGYRNTEEIMKEYADFLGIAALSADKYKTLAGGSYMSKTALRNAAQGNSSSASARPAGNGGGSGSGGTKYNASGTMPDTKFEEENETKAELTRIVIPFEDIDSVAWAAEAITALYDRQIINGKTENRFYPEDYVTREEFVKMIVCALNIQPESDLAAFSDVPTEAWYNGYVYAALKNGFVSGVGENEFGSGLNITRQDLAVIICNAITVPSAQNAVEFTDSSEIADYAKNAVEKLSALGIINGTESGAFEPNSCATRAETAQMLYGALKFLNLQEVSVKTH